MKLLAKLTVVLLPLVVLTACSGSDDTHDSRDSGLTTATERAYFNGLSHNTLDSLQKALGAAAPGSVAEAYATYVRGVAQAATDAGTPYDEGEDVTKVDGGYRQCLDDDEVETCYEYGAIEGAGGKVADFTMNGHAIDTRIVAGGGRPAAVKGGGSSAGFVAAYRSTEDTVFVVVRLTAGSKGVTQVQARYGSGGAEPVKSNNQAGPSDLAAGKQASYLFVFPKSELGGTLTLTIADRKFVDSTLILQTPTRE